MLTPSLSSKLDALSGYLTDLCEIRPTNLETFRDDKMLRRYAERMLHMAIDSCLNIGIEVLTSSGFRTPENYHDIFIALGEHNVLTPTLVSSMTNLVELRNLLVYEHDAIEDVAVYGALKKRVDDLEEYVRAIHAFAAGEPFVPSPSYRIDIDESDE